MKTLRILLMSLIAFATLSSCQVNKEDVSPSAIVYQCADEIELYADMQGDFFLDSYAEVILDLNDQRIKAIDRYRFHTAVYNTSKQHGGKQHPDFKINAEKAQNILNDVYYNAQSIHAKLRSYNAKVKYMLASSEAVKHNVLDHRTTLRRIEIGNELAQSYKRVVSEANSNIGLLPIDFHQTLIVDSCYWENSNGIITYSPTKN